MLVHGSNLTQKEKKQGKYQDDLSKQYLSEIRYEYDKWHTENMKLKGPIISDRDPDTDLIKQRVALFETYKNFIDQKHYAEHFDSRSNLHSSVLEEFVYYLFKDLIENFSPYALLGKSHTFKDIFFAASSYSNMLERPFAKIETKDHDFVIGVTVKASLQNTQPGMSIFEKDSNNPEIQSNLPQESSNFNDELWHSDTETHFFDIPAVAIECKTYLDKTMLEGSSRASEELKARNPNAIYIIVTEWIKLSEHVNFKKYKVDQIYILRKQKNTDREFRYSKDYSKNPIDSDVVIHLYMMIYKHLTNDWNTTLKSGIQRGWLL